MEKYKPTQIREDVFERLTELTIKHDVKKRKLVTELVNLGLGTKEFKEAEKKGLIF